MIMNNLRFVKINIHNTEYIYDYNEVLELYAQINITRLK